MQASGLTIQRVPAAYAQVAAHLRDEITAGCRQDGSLLPSVRGLAADLGISTGTARAALTALCREGIALAIPGIGTVVRYSAHRGAENGSDQR